MDGLYVWFLQKTSQKSNEPPYPLPRAIARLIEASGFTNDLIVSPGYLSTNQNTTKQFFLGFDNLIQPDHKSSVGFLRGVNGASFDTYLSNHKTELCNSTHKFEFGPEFDLTNSHRDHRKMIFLYSVPDECVKKSIYHKAEALEFIRSIKVNAVAIGSSNFSNTTYFGAFDKGEADVILLAHDPDSKTSDF